MVQRTRGSNGSTSWPVPARTVQNREHAHRRAVLIALGALIILSASPVFGHHLLSGSSLALAGRDHLLGICLIALHELLAPVHFGFHVMFALGPVYAIVDRIRALRAARKTLGALDAPSAAKGSMIARAAAAAGLSHDDVRVVAALPNPAFTVGWWRPRVYVAAEIGDVLTEAQLTAVLAHEAAHVARRDPLKLSGLRFLACTLFYLPTFRRLAEDVADEAEIVADDAAVRGNPLLLAETLVLLATAWSQKMQAHSDRAALRGVAVGFQRAGLIERRVRRLVGQDVPIQTHVTRRSIAGAASVLLAIFMSGLIMAHPLAAEGAHLSLSGSPLANHPGTKASHCQHHAEFAIDQLFCLGLHHRASRDDCPHAQH